MTVAKRSHFTPTNGNSQATRATRRSAYLLVGAALTLICSGVVSASTSIDQMGSDIDGEAADDRFGVSVSLSDDGTIVAIGGGKNDAGATDGGHVQVYQYSGGAWSQLGDDINGDAATEQSGWAISLSSDGTIVAIGAPLNEGTPGRVKVYQYSSGAWSQLGSDIDGEAADDQFGRSVSLSSDGTILAIGARYNDGNGDNAGRVQVYQYSSGAWSQLGADIDGEAVHDEFGRSVSLSSDGTILAIGAPGNDAGGYRAGHVRVYQYSSGAWSQLGDDIDGEAADDRSGGSVSLSSDGTILAIGAPFNDESGSDAGHVRVYQYSSGTWSQLGDDIDGEAADDRSGYSVSLSSDGTKLAVGAHQNDGNGTNAGHVRVHQYSSGTWSQLGADINGETAGNPDLGDKSGWSVSLSSDGTKVAIGAPLNDGNGTNAGHVRVYSITTSTPTTTISTPSASGPRVPGQVPPWPEAILNVDGTVTVSWQAPFDDGNGPITGYRVASSPSGGSCSTTGLTCVIAGLDPNVGYLFDVFASNSDGEGPGRLTQQSIRIVPQTPATTVPAAPQLLPVTPATPEPLPETGNDDHLVTWSMLLIAFGALSVLSVRRTRLN